MYIGSPTHSFLNKFSKATTHPTTQQYKLHVCQSPLAVLLEEEGIKPKEENPGN